ncbi:MAG: RadC family protein [Clostridia bacterium]|nr:RadC family protein [Clostridia bacterium]
MDELVHRGHRSRMRRKFSDFGARVFDTYELLEMLLYNTVPVKDTNPISKRLLAEFGSLDGVLSADAESLMNVDGVGKKTAEMLVTVGEALEICKTEYENSTDSRTFSNYAELGEYLVKYYKGAKERSVLLLSFDNNMKLIGMDEIYSNIDFESGAVIAKPFIDASIYRSASLVVVAHNHPFGPICPTEGDRQTNYLVEGAFDNIGVLLVEHYVVCGDDYLGFMSHMSTAFAQRPALRKFFEGKGGVIGV